MSAGAARAEVRPLSPGHNPDLPGLTFETSPLFSVGQCCPVETHRRPHMCFTSSSGPIRKSKETGGSHSKNTL